MARPRLRTGGVRQILLLGTTRAGVDLPGHHDCAGYRAHHLAVLRRLVPLAGQPGLLVVAEAGLAALDAPVGVDRRAFCRLSRLQVAAILG